MISDEFKRDFSFYNQVVLAFSFILGIAYLYGYWSAFDINIFPFLSLFDLVRFSAYPLLILYVPLLLLQWTITELHFAEYIQTKSKQFASHLYNHPNWFIRNVVALLIVVSYFSFVIWLGFYLQQYTLKVGVPIASIITLAWLRNALKKAGNEQDVKMFHRYGRALLILCLLPFISYDYGRHKGDVILKDKEYSYASFKEGESNNLYKFLGYLDGHYFFIDKNNHKLLINNKLDSLELRHFLKKGEKDSPDIGFT